MTGAAIAQLILVLGPQALDVIEKLVDNWNKEMTPEELKAFCQSNRKSKEQWLAWARTQLGTPTE